jgi:glyoxylase-like metal-dependent hydrolase (beta-lactamase superfamily II)
MKTPDYDKPVRISEHAYWVGTYDPRDKFQCNSYVIVINGKGIIIDPGSMLYFENLISKVSELVDLKDITHIIVQHQDPDVAGNIVMLMDTIRARGNETCKIITHKRTSALIRHYGENLTFEYCDELPEEELLLGDGYALKFIHTPYLHAPGAIATYFNKDGILFSGDIFGGMVDNWDLYAGENYFQEITSFHKDYMPAKELLLYAMTKFERFDIETIAPQHGSVLNKEQAKAIIEHFRDFECGLYVDQSFRDELSAARKQIESDKRIDIAFLFEPCNQVSGDFLIIDKIDDQHLGILVTDVVGHGVMPGLATIQVKTLFDEHKKASLSPAAILRIMNERSFSSRPPVVYPPSTMSPRKGRGNLFHSRAPLSECQWMVSVRYRKPV